MYEKSALAIRRGVFLWSDRKLTRQHGNKQESKGNNDRPKTRKVSKRGEWKPLLTNYKPKL